MCLFLGGKDAGDFNFLGTFLHFQTFLQRKEHVLFILPKENMDLTKILTLRGCCRIPETVRGLQAPELTSLSPGL